jgi:hypothetical protein
MNTFGTTIAAEAQLSATIIRADGSHRHTLLSQDKFTETDFLRKLRQPLNSLRKLYENLNASKALPLGLTFVAFAQALREQAAKGRIFNLVTTAGVNYLAADFLTSSTNHIANFNFHDSGTGTVAAAIGDTALGTQAGPTTRATGTQSIPTAGTYKSIGTVSYTSSLAITEFGLFSQAAQGGTLWDRRTFAAINVVSGDSVTFQYSVVVNAGGS